MRVKPLITDYRRDAKLFAGFWPNLGLIIAILITVIYPFIMGNYWLGVANHALITIVGAVSLMILTGFTGQISLGHAAFFAIGAYTTAILANEWMLPFWLTLPVAGIVAGLVGLAIGPLALRLRGVYLAIVTIALIYLVNHVLFSFPEWTKGSSGIAVPIYAWFTSEPSQFGHFSEPFRILGKRFDLEFKLYYIFLAIAFAVTLFAKNLQRSSHGRAMMAVRDHDIAASAMGINPARVKILALVISSFIAGIGGGMLGYSQQFLTIDPPFNLQFSIEYIAIIVIGGAGTIFGAVAGAIVFVYLAPFAEMVGEQLPYIQELSSAQQSLLLFSFVVGIILLYEPLGLFGIWLRIKRFFMTWPFRH